MRKTTLLSFLILAGCAAKPAPIHAIVGTDGSGSARPHLSDYVQTLVGVAGRLSPGHDRLTVFRFDRTAREVYGPDAPRSMTQFQLRMVDAFAPTSNTRGTIPADFFERSADLLEKGATPAVVVCLTDGGNDDLSAKGNQRMRDVAERLAKNPNVVAVVIAGCVPGTREKIRDLLAPLGDKLKFCELAEVGGEVRR